jgi:hypothetical protein
MRAPHARHPAPRAHRGLACLTLVRSKKFIAATDLCTFCWARPLPEFERPSVQERWPCTCVRTHGTGESSTGKRKHDAQAALARIQKKAKDIGDAPF